MLLSMTGYGKATCSIAQKQLTIEIKSLNSKQFDLNSRILQTLKEKEVEIRNIISGQLNRGKVELSIRAESENNESSRTINNEVAKNYYNQIQQLTKELNISTDGDKILQSILRIPEVFSTTVESIQAEDWDKIRSSILEACEELTIYRKTEGESLEKDITQRINNIENLLTQVIPFEKQRIETIKTRLSQAASNISGSVDVNNERFEQELIYYLEKLDITEEKVRLANHCSYFIDTIESEEQIGKKLGFITQEIGREINTLGSKANNTDIQKIVVQMKDELEKIKEQLMNIL